VPTIAGRRTSNCRTLCSGVLDVALHGYSLRGSRVAIGTGAAALLSRFLIRFLYEVQPIDPVVYGALAAMLLLTATLAAYLPARRATRVDPAVVLKHDG